MDKLICNKVKIFNPEECEKIINDFELNSNHIKISTEHGVNRISSYEIDFKYFSDNIKELINNKINDVLLPITGGKKNMIFGVRYSLDTKSYMLPHYDCNSYSCVIELNKDFKGGGTHFPIQNLIVNSNEIGEGILFRGDTIKSYHAANPISEGVRYVLVIRTENKNILHLLLRTLLLSVVDKFFIKFLPKLHKNYSMDPSYKK
jgi:hypothetical protein